MAVGYLPPDMIARVEELLAKDRIAQAAIQERSTWQLFRVALDFCAWGLRGREVLDLRAPDELSAVWKAASSIESELIDAGAAARECGCCLLLAEEGGDVSALSSRVEQLLQFQPTRDLQAEVDRIMRSTLLGIVEPV